MDSRGQRSRIPETESRKWRVESGQNRIPRSTFHIQNFESLNPLAEMGPENLHYAGGRRTLDG